MALTSKQQAFVDALTELNIQFTLSETSGKRSIKQITMEGDKDSSRFEQLMKSNMREDFLDRDGEHFCFPLNVELVNGYFLLDNTDFSFKNGPAVVTRESSFTKSNVKFSSDRPLSVTRATLQKCKVSDAFLTTQTTKIVDCGFDKIEELQTSNTLTLINSELDLSFLSNATLPPAKTIVSSFPSNVLKIGTVNLKAGDMVISDGKMSNIEGQIARLRTFSLSFNKEQCQLTSLSFLKRATIGKFVLTEVPEDLVASLNEAIKITTLELWYDKVDLTKLTAPCGPAHLKYINVEHGKITAGGLGLLLFENLSDVNTADNRFNKAWSIIKRFNAESIYDAQEALMSNGYEKYTDI